MKQGKLGALNHTEQKIFDRFSKLKGTPLKLVFQLRLVFSWFNWSAIWSPNMTN